MLQRRRFLAGALALSSSHHLPRALAQTRNEWSYPRAVELAGAQRAFDRRDANGWRTSPTKWVGKASLDRTGFVDDGRSVSSTRPGSILEGWDTNGRNIVINHNQCIVRDCRVWIEKGPQNGIWVSTGRSVDSTLVEYNEFDGRAEAVLGSGTMVVPIFEHGKADVVNSTFRGNYLHHMQGDGINVCGGGALVELNRIMIGGWGQKRAHFDGIAMLTLNNKNESIIRDNWLDLTPDASKSGTFGRTSSVALYSCDNGVLVEGNIIGFGAPMPDNGYVEAKDRYLSDIGRAYVLYSMGPTNANIRIRKNVFDYYSVYGGPIYSRIRKGLTEWSDNFRLRDAMEIPNPGNT